MVWQGEGRDKPHHDCIATNSLPPHSLKLLWAPVVDSLYIKALGRRKSWVIPVQFAVGLVMIALSHMVGALLDTDDPNVLYLTVVFLVL